MALELSGEDLLLKNAALERLEGEIAVAQGSTLLHALGAYALALSHIDSETSARVLAIVGAHLGKDALLDERISVLIGVAAQATPKMFELLREVLDDTRRFSAEVRSNACGSLGWLYLSADPALREAIQDALNRARFDGDQTVAERADLVCQFITKSTPERCKAALQAERRELRSLVVAEPPTLA